MNKIQKIINEIKKSTTTEEDYFDLFTEKLIENNIYFFRFTDTKYFNAPGYSVIFENIVYYVFKTDACHSRRSLEIDIIRQKIEDKKISAKKWLRIYDRDGGKYIYLN